jgi:hypothetical protein
MTSSVQLPVQLPCSLCTATVLPTPCLPIDKLHARTRAARLPHGIGSSRQAKLHGCRYPHGGGIDLLIPASVLDIKICGNLWSRHGRTLNRPSLSIVLGRARICLKINIAPSSSRGHVAAHEMLAESDQWVIELLPSKGNIRVAKPEIDGDLWAQRSNCKRSGCAREARRNANFWRNPWNGSPRKDRGVCRCAREISRSLYSRHHHPISRRPAASP